jgi:hypothetical protein
MKKVLIAPIVAGLLFLSACSNASSAQTAPQANVNGNGGPNGAGRGVYQQNLQQYADEANNAPDKTELSKDQFTAEMQTLMQQQRAQFRAGSGGQLSSNMQGFGSGRMMNGQRFGSGAFARGGGPRFGSGAARSGGIQNGLAAAVSFYKYTDPQGNEALIALNANGQVVMHWPMPFGRGARGFGSGQPPMGNQNNQPAQQ